MQYLLSLPGKSVRTKVLFGFNQWFHVPAEKLMVINRVVELLHTASLLIDDVQDESKLRRGLPAAHCIFGVAQTINAANHAYFMAQKHLARLDNPETFRIFTEELLNLHRGQGMDIYWRDCLVCPTEEEYLDMVSDKTGGLFRLGIRLILVESRKASENSLTLVDLLGIVFQIRDDYQNIWSDAYAGKKGYCEDLTEGKFSFPIIHSFLSDSETLQLIHILKQRTEDDTVKNFAKEYMESRGSHIYCKHRVSSLMQQARDLVKEIETEMGKSPGINEILDYLES
ncbi:geranylgeranyl pyrophosphate synthase [Penicillium pulvis]|uniref:geranylgeranyl pyrophosphate synthase n=1 Tax=Penicillium pulvis TaxID=1562058 RepID=UPI0025470814|nr:geranylgeranyl pyrophosphate synthase [Penicillium pulvis]KAJ5803033.1 geranylgeranyl pyrophosphate synthase [Penicillium pulvis]